MNPKIEIVYSFVPASSVKIGSGHGRYGIVDQTYQTSLNAEGTELFLIPGSTVKGKIRSVYRQLGHLFSEQSKQEEQLIFGGPGVSGWAKFSALRPNEGETKLQPIASTAVDRFRKASKTATLRIQEYASFAENKKLTGTIEGYVPETSGIPFSVACLLAAVLQTDRFGGGITAGYGKGTIQLESVCIGSKEYKNQALQDELMRVLEKGRDQQ